ncbi:MAG: tetratricopeptide repeat protein [Bacteroidia bacterium]
MKKYLFLIVSVCCFAIAKISAQTKLIDSLVLRLNNPAQDTNTVKMQNDLAWAYIMRGDFDNCSKYVNDALKLAKKIKFTKGLAKANSIIGGIYYHKGDFDKSLEYHHIALKLREEINDKLGVSASLNNIGIIFDSKRDYKKALEIHLKSLKIKEELGDQIGASYSYNSLGIIYYRTMDFPKALEYYAKALALQEKFGDKKGASGTHSNMGNVYKDSGQEEKAIEQYFIALKLREEVGDNYGIASSHLIIGDLYLRQQKINEAQKQLKIGLEMGIKLASKPIAMQSYHSLSTCDSSLGNYKSAYENYRKYLVLRDSIFTLESNERIAKAQSLYESEKKDKEIQLLNKDKEAQALISLEESKKQKIIIFSICGGLILLLIFSLFIFNRFKVTQKQKHIIEAQKEIVEEKHKEITDSINYAERIQRSFLATKELLTENLKDHFVFFQPKDIVSGDFYWGSKLSNGNFALVTADSTGHGVPGAIMSILNISCLEKSVEEKKLFEPNEILGHTRIKIIERLKKDGSAEGGKDGMDCSLISFDFTNNKITFAGANNPIWIVRNNQILEFAPDKMPVGKHDKDNIAFSQQMVDLQKQDMIYALTDGMPDQFGGPKGKKFMYKQLKDLLITISILPVGEQKQALQIALNNWKGDYEQVDDICLIGIRV